MKYVWKIIATFLWLACAPAFAEEPLPDQVPPHGETVVTTQHHIKLGNGRRLDYVAHAGLIPLYVNDTGENMASMFFVGYFAKRPAGAPPRPITFLWHGGPGSSSSEMHFIGTGPRRAATAPSFPEFGPNTELPVIDNPDTWLDETDLVYVDPVGTGFSRATSEKFRDILYTAHGDAEAAAELMRIVLNRYDRWTSPLYFGGESYGTLRASLVAEALARRRTPISGVLLISGMYDVDQSMAPALKDALEITMFTATAWYHKRLPADLMAETQEQAIAQAENWARETYAPALERRDRLTAPERQAVLAGLERYTGVARAVADQKTLLLSKDQFADHLLADRGLELGRYDLRLSTPVRPKGTFWLPQIDPSIMGLGDLMDGSSHVFNRYVRQELGFNSDLLYRGPFGFSFHPAPLRVDPDAGYTDDWMALMFQVPADALDGGPGESALHHAMRLQPEMRVLNIRGLYDGSCAALDEGVKTTELNMRRRISSVCVPSGHMYYTDQTSRRMGKNAFKALLAQVPARQ